MSCPFSEEQLAQLKAFVDLCTAQPAILQHPKLSFFKDYLTNLGVSIPTATFEPKTFSASGDSNATNANPEDNAAISSEEESDEESDVELDMDGVISDTSEANQEMGDDSKEVTDEERDQSDEKRSEAMRAFSEQQFDEAIALYTEAIKLNPQSALLFAKRGQVFLKQNKLHACIKDCTRALELNCDSAAAYKFRGRAYRLLGKFEEALHDLCESLKIDYDDQTNEWLSEVKPNAEKLRQHKLTVQRKKEEKEVEIEATICQQCFDEVMHQLSTRYIALQLDTNACVWCRRSLFQRRKHDLPDGPVKREIAARIFPREIPNNALVCYTCWDYACRLVQYRPDVRSSPKNTNVCVCCTRSLNSRRSHTLPEGLERNLIAEIISPRQHNEKLRRARKAQEARANAAKSQAESQPSFNVPPGMGGFEAADFMKLLSDPEIVAAFKDPEIANAFYDVSSNPANFIKYQNNPKVAAALELLKGKFGVGGATAPPGGFSGFDGANPAGTKPSSDDDVGLD